MKEKNHQRILEKRLNLSHKFKFLMLVILFSLIAVHLYFVFAYPAFDIISTKIILGISLFIVSYIWVKDNTDRHILLRLNRELINAHQDLVKSNIDTISTLVSTEEAKDPYTRGHCGRVTKYAIEIAKELGLTKEGIEVIKNAGFLHDVGKIGVGDVILHKPGELTDQEWQLVKRHPLTALKILLPLKFLPEEKEIILHHHERYDGKGYPEGLKGEQVPLGARIMAVADAFDAMNSDRPYRRRLSREEIISELKNAKNSQHDPKIVDALFRCLKKNPHFWNLD